MSATTAQPATRATDRSGTLTGTLALVRFALRRDRVRLPVWLAAITLTVLSTLLTLPELYADAADRQARAALMANPAAIMLGGPQVGAADYTFGAMMTNEMLGFAAVLVALMSILLLVRHTRTDEEAGRTELIRANVVGRHAPLTAALLVVVGANLALAVLLAVGLGTAGVESVDWAGSWLFALALAAVGATFAAVAAVTAQVTEHARGATGLAGLALGVAYALRAAGDIGNDVLSWLSPIGWAQRTFAYVDDRWWPLLPAVATSAALIVAAVVLSSRRDVGAGLRPPRPGPPVASDRLATPVGLALRLQRASLISWVLAVLASGLLFGALLGDIEGFAAEMEAVGAVLGDLEGALVEGFVALLVSLLAMAAGVHAILATLRARAEETAGRAEPVLATPMSRTAWLAGHLAVAVVGSTAILLAGALGLGLSAAATLADGGMVVRVLGAGLVHVVPLLFTVGVATALFGLVPKASAAAWTVMVYALTVGMLGGLLGLPSWAMELSPYAAVPLLPAEDLTAAPILVLLALAAGLLAAGVAGFRRRDLTTTA